MDISIERQKADKHLEKCLSAVMHNPEVQEIVRVIKKIVCQQIEDRQSMRGDDRE